MYLRCGIEQRRARDLALAAGFALRSIMPISSARRMLHAVAPPRQNEATLPVTTPAWIVRYR
jgi:hypothetical protein